MKKLIILAILLVIIAIVIIAILPKNSPTSIKTGTSLTTNQQPTDRVPVINPGSFQPLIIATSSKGPETPAVQPDILPTGYTSENLISLINKERLDVGLPALKHNPILDMAASHKIDDMVANQYYAHTSPTGKDFTDFLHDVGYFFPLTPAGTTVPADSRISSQLGENLALAINWTPAELVSQWMASAPHKANILDPRFSETGIAFKEVVITGNWSVTDDFGNILTKDFTGMKVLITAEEFGGSAVVKK